MAVQVNGKLRGQVEVAVDALEAAGERELALQCFRTVSQLDAGYRGVGGRLLALGGRPGPDDDDAPPARKRNAGSR